MKRMYLLVTAAMVYIFILSGCSAPIQLAADLVGNMGASALKSDSPKASNVEVLKKIDVNGYSIEIVRARNLPDTIAFGAKKQEKTMGAFIANQKEFQEFTSMNEHGGKQFLRENFLKYGGLDLGPVEPEATEKTSAPAPSSPLNIPVPGFAPNPNPLPR